MSRITGIMYKMSHLSHFSAVQIMHPLACTLIESSKSATTSTACWTNAALPFSSALAQICMFSETTFRLKKKKVTVNFTRVRNVPVMMKYRKM